MCEKRKCRVSRVYAERYPNRNQPSRREFGRIMKLFQETGSIHPRKRNRRNHVTDENMEVAVLAALQVKSNRT